MNKIKKQTLWKYITYSLVIVFGIALDQITKFLAVKYLKPIDDFPIIKGYLHLTYHENTGMAFGMLADADKRWIFMTISLIAIVGIGIYLYMGKAPNMLYGLALSAIVAGGIGNMIDRVYLKYVVDFISCRNIPVLKVVPIFESFPVFNIADSFVTVASVGLIALLLNSVIFDTERDFLIKANWLRPLSAIETVERIIINNRKDAMKKDGRK